MIRQLVMEMPWWMLGLTCLCLLSLVGLICLWIAAELAPRMEDGENKFGPLGFENRRKS